MLRRGCSGLEAGERALGRRGIVDNRKPRAPGGPGARREGKAQTPPSSAPIGARIRDPAPPKASGTCIPLPPSWHGRPSRVGRRCRDVRGSPVRRRAHFGLSDSPCARRGPEICHLLLLLSSLPPSREFWLRSPLPLPLRFLPRIPFLIELLC